MRKNKILWIVLLVLIVTLAACSGSSSEKAEDEQQKDTNDGPPSIDDLDPDDELTPFIKDGKELLDDTHDVLADESENKLSCMSCHADGSDSGGESLVGITSEYPKYDEREGAVITLEEKVNDGLTRTLNTEKLDYDGEELRSIIAYLTYISKGIKVGEGVAENEDAVEIEEIPEPDLDNGKKLYNEKLKDSSPELWGEHSFTDGSSLARMSVMTNFVRNYLPENEPGSLSDQEAADVAGYILSKDRPGWEDDDSEWPDNGKPADFINKEEREAIQKGDFDWSQVNDD